MQLISRTRASAHLPPWPCIRGGWQGLESLAEKLKSGLKDRACHPCDYNNALRTSPFDASLNSCASCASSGRRVFFLSQSTRAELAAVSDIDTITITNSCPVRLYVTSHEPVQRQGHQTHKGDGASEEEAGAGKKPPRGGAEGSAPGGGCGGGASEEEAGAGGG